MLYIRGTTMTVQELPEFHTPVDMTAWSDEQIDTFLDGVRFRRMQTRVLYEKTMELKAVAELAKIEVMFTKKMEKLAKAIIAFDKHIEKLEKVSNEVRAMRLQMGQKDML